MSLLMDALRKAEEAKRAAAQSGNSAPPEAPPTVEAATVTPAPPPSPLQELGLEPMAPASGQASPPPFGNPPRNSAPPDAEQRQAIQNVFAAKKTPGGPEDRAFVFAVAGVAVLVALGIGTYVWWQMQPRSSLSVMPSAMPNAMAQQSPQPPLAALPAVPAVTPPEAPASTTPTTTKAASAAMPATGQVERSQPRPTIREREPAPSPVRLTRKSPRVSPLLEEGYAALQQGNLVQAQTAYERMLSSDPKSADALYGLAAIALQRRQPELAEDYYLRILESNPRDAYAHAGLTGLRGHAASANAESRLKTLIADQPDVAPLHFALGNLYAQEQRWREAQQAYFLAYQFDSTNPDITFNLAVSLDQLRQGRLAAQYYAEALRLSGQQPAAFSREQAQARLLELRAASEQ